MEKLTKKHIEIILSQLTFELRLVRKQFDLMSEPKAICDEDTKKQLALKVSAVELRAKELLNIIETK